MPTAAEYAKSGGYDKDAKISKDFAKVSLPKSPSSSSSSRSSSSSNKTSTPPSGGYMSVPKAGGSVPPPSSYQSGGSTYTPGPSNWGGMDQSQRDAYTSGVMGPGMIKRGGSAPPINKISIPGSWQDGVPQGGYVPGMINKISIPGQWPGTPVPYSPTPGSNQYKIAVPGQWGGTSAPPSAQSVDEKNRAEAKARMDKQRAGLASAVDLTKTGLKNTYDYTNQIQKDQRVLEDQRFLRNSNPYGGSQGYLAADMARNRSIADTAATKDYTANTAAADKRLADFDALAPEQQDAMYNELQRIERQFQMDEGALTGNYKGGRTLAGQGLDQSQFNADRQYGLSQSDLALRQQGQQFNQGMAQSQFGLQQQNQSYNQFANDRNFNYGAGQDQLKNDAQYGGVYNPSGLSYDQVSREMADNSAAWHKASPEQQTQLNQRNQYLGSLIGKQYDPGTGEYTQGNSYVGMKTPDQQQREFGQAVTLNELKFKQDSYQQTFKENVRQFDTSTALEQAYKAGQLTLEQARTAISQQQANTASSRNNWDMSPSNPDNLLKKLQVDQFGRPKAITPEEVISQLNKSTFVELDENTKRPIVYDSQGLAKSILSLNMATKDTDYLFSYYNIDKNKLLQQLSGN